MDSYRGFAAVYDLFMEKDIPYHIWAGFIDKILRDVLPVTNRKPVVLDLACGTGNITLRLARRGYDMIGVDASEDMLTQAQAKAFIQRQRVLWLAQDIRALDLYGTVDAALCTCDGLNYILEPDELREVFGRVRLFLNPGGVFIFDVNTEYKYKEILGSKSFGDEAGGAKYIWNNTYDPVTQINEYRLRFYIKGDNPATFDEVHRQRAYNLGSLTHWLMDAGFHSIQIRDGYSDAPPRADGKRAVFICGG
jgi:SAM-dependent methyltransferase